MKTKCNSSRIKFTCVGKDIFTGKPFNSPTTSNDHSFALWFLPKSINKWHFDYYHMWLADTIIISWRNAMIQFSNSFYRFLLLWSVLRTVNRRCTLFSPCSVTFTALESPWTFVCLILYSWLPFKTHARRGKSFISSVTQR